MEQSSFGRLPPELRNVIYELSQPTAQSITIDFERRHRHHAMLEPAGYAGLLPLTMTCKRIRVEFGSLFWSKQHFVFDLGVFDRNNSVDEDSNPATRLITWLRVAGYDNARYIRQAELKVTFRQHPWYGNRAPRYLSEALARLANFFARIGTEINLSVDVMLFHRPGPLGFESVNGFMHFDLPLMDHKAGVLEIETVTWGYVSSIYQAARDGNMCRDSRDALASLRRIWREEMIEFVWCIKGQRYPVAEYPVFKQEASLEIAKKSAIVVLKPGTDRLSALLDGSFRQYPRPGTLSLRV